MTRAEKKFYGASRPRRISGRVVCPRGDDGYDVVDDEIEKVWCNSESVVKRKTTDQQNTLFDK